MLKVALTNKATLEFRHASYLYPFSRAQSPRRLFKYAKRLKADLTRNTHHGRPEVHTPDSASQNQLNLNGSIIRLTLYY